MTKSIWWSGREFSIKSRATKPFKHDRTIILRHLQYPHPETFEYECPMASRVAPMEDDIPSLKSIIRFKHVALHLTTFRDILQINLYYLKLACEYLRELCLIPIRLELTVAT